MSTTQTVYRGKQLRALAMPLGGLGTGSIALCGDGSLRQWQIHNQVNHLAMLSHSFFAVWTQRQGQTVARILQSAETYSDAGFAPAPSVSDHLIPPACTDLLQRCPGVQQIEFTGEYPIAEIAYLDDALPVRVTLEAFSPFIPLNDKDSGLPLILFHFTITNTSDRPVAVSLCAALQNAVGWDGLMPGWGVDNQLYGGNINTLLEEDGLTALEMRSQRLDVYPDHEHFGQMVLGALTEDAHALPQWDNLDAFWTDFAGDGAFDESDDEPPPSRAGRTWNGALAVPLALPPGATGHADFLYAWYFPNHYVNWNQEVFGITDTRSRFFVGTRYGETFPGARAVAEYARDHHARLTDETRRFRATFYDSTLPYPLLDAATSQISTLRTPVCFWSADDFFYGFEGGNGASTGSRNAGGCCPLNCAHVWNYEQALAKLFPRLERTMRDVDWAVQQTADGSIPFRTVLPHYLPRWTRSNRAEHSTIAADGHFGTVLKTYREYRQSGDRAWLDGVWPHVKLGMEYAFRQWDADGDGVCDGAQWNTYDCYVYGHNTFISGLYLAALRACEAMATVQGDDALAQECRQRFERGRANLDAELWNGEYYIQTVDLQQHPQHQYGPGCHADQLLGQWWAHILDLGYLLPPERVQSALRALFRHNWRTDMAGHKQQPRTYLKEDEAGLLICTWPRGGRPGPGSNDVTKYSDEVWTGIEYAATGALLFEGITDEAFTILRTVRRRQNGAFRSPWNEVECGDHYVRPMSSWALLDAAAGLSYSAADAALRFMPQVTPGDFAVFFSGAAGWGRLAQRQQDGAQQVTLRADYGEITLQRLALRALPGQAAAQVTADAAGRRSAATWQRDGDTVQIVLAAPLTIAAGETLTITLR